MKVELEGKEAKKKKGDEKHIEVYSRFNTCVVGVFTLVALHGKITMGKQVLKSI